MGYERKLYVEKGLSHNRRHQTNCWLPLFFPLKPSFPQKSQMGNQRAQGKPKLFGGSPKLHKKGKTTFWTIVETRHKAKGKQGTKKRRPPPPPPRILQHRRSADPAIWKAGSLSCCCARASSGLASCRLGWTGDGKIPAVKSNPLGEWAVSGRERWVKRIGNPPGEKNSEPYEHINVRVLLEGGKGSHRQKQPLQRFPTVDGCEIHFAPRTET